MPEEYLQDIAKAALKMIGCGYIYGATGWICTVKRVEQQAKQYPEYESLIRKYGLGKWLGKRCYDCAQLTRAAAKAGGVTLPSGATSQWNADVWETKGTIDTLPDDPTGCLLYRQSGGKMQHTGVCVGGSEFVDSRGHASGVLQTAISGYKWTHWACPRKPGNTVGGGAQEGGITVDYMGLSGKTVMPANLKVGTKTINLRSEPTTEGNKPICRVPLGDKLKCVSVSDEWALCDYGNVRGYCMAKFLTVAEENAGSSETDAERFDALEARVAALEKLVIGEAGTVG